MLTRAGLITGKRIRQWVFYRRVDDRIADAKEQLSSDWELTTATTATTGPEPDRHGHRTPVRSRSTPSATRRCSRPCS